MKKQRIGIVGNGSMAVERAKEFNKAGAEVIGVHARDINKARTVAEVVGAAAYEKYEALLDAVDAVVICMPNFLHAKIALQALQRGKHALVEYPLCISGDELTALRAAAKSSGRVLMTGNTIIREAPYRFITEHQKKLGTLFSAASRVDFHSPDFAGVWYFDREKRGSAFAAMHYHHIEYYRRLLGPVRWVMASDQSQQGLRLGGALMMGHDDGRTSCIQCYFSSEGSGLSRGMWLTGSLGSLSIIAQSAGMSHAIWNGGEDGKVETIPDEWGIAGSCKDFLDAIDGKFDHQAELESDAETMRVGWLASQSAETGRRIDL